MDDKDIVELYLQRDEAAIAFSAEKYGSRLKSLAFGITFDHQTAEECESDTYLNAWNLIPPNEPRTFLFGFLARITRHLSIDRCRRQESLKRKAQIVELSLEMEMCLPAKEDVISSIGEKELGDAISSFLKTISKEKRVVFMRRYFYLDSISEIAARCGMSESKVKSMLFRIRSNLKEYLIREGFCI